MRRRYQHTHQQPQQRHVVKMVLVFLTGALTGVLVGLRLALIVLWRSGADALLHRVGLFNKRWTNRFAMKVLRAGQPHSPYALIRHVGRSSGREYATPVITAHVHDAFIVPLAYGQSVDWYRNVRAAGGCTIEWQGQSYHVGAPAMVPAAQAIPAFPRLWGRELRLYGITHFLQMPIIASSTAWQVDMGGAQMPVAHAG